MRLKSKFRAPKVDLAKFKRALHARLSEKLADGCRQWLTTVVKESTNAGLPIWSAASISTFAPLASHVAFAMANTPADGVTSRVEVGVANGRAEYHPGTQRPGVYTFVYSTTLPHLIINEYHNANTFINPNTGLSYFHLKHPGPYDFQKKAAAAFRRFASDVRLPGWESILQVEVIVNG